MEIQVLDVTEEKLLTLWSFGKELVTTEELIYKTCDYFMGIPYQLLVDPFIPKESLEKLLQSLANEEEFTFTLDSFDCVTFVETVLALVLARHCRDVVSFSKVLIFDTLTKHP